MCGSGVRWRLVWLLLTPALLVLAACNASASYQPPILPLVFTLESDGTFVVEGVAEVATPLGQFSVNVDAMRLTPKPDDGILLYIDHVVEDRYVEDRFHLDTDGPLVVTQEGRTTTTFTSDFIRIIAQDSVTKITVRSGAKGTGPPADRRVFVGRWRGPVDQPGSQPYSMQVSLTLRDGRLSGQVEYPELKCGGRLTESSGVPGGMVFLEKITHGLDRCVTEGQWSMAPITGGRVAASYSSGESLTADATLTRRR
jgi:hypothetical protein